MFDKKRLIPGNNVSDLMKNNSLNAAWVHNYNCQKQTKWIPENNIAFVYTFLFYYNIKWKKDIPKKECL